MKVNLEVIPHPSSSSYNLMGTLDRELLRESKTIIVDSSMETKTRISNSLQVGSFRAGMNLDVEGFKTVGKIEICYLSGEHNYPCYFKVSKAQDVERFKEYIIESIKIVLKDYFHLTLDEVTIKLMLPSVFN